MSEALSLPCPNCGAPLQRKPVSCARCGWPAGQEPTASALVYLFADKFVATSPRSASGAEVPCRGIKVHAVSLAAVLCAVALWSLREQQLIMVQTVEQKRVYFFFWTSGTAELWTQK